MRKILVARTARQKDYGVQIVDLHSQLYQVAMAQNTLRLPAWELRHGRPARVAFDILHRLRREIPPSASLGDVSAYYRKLVVEWYGYWLHGDIPVGDFLNAIEKGLGLALSGDADFTRPLRELNKQFPYKQAPENLEGEDSNEKNN